MSPPATQSYLSPLPPAKRHQAGPPGQSTATKTPNQRPPQNGPAPYPPYQFYQPGESPYPGAYHGPNYSSALPGGPQASSPVGPPSSYWQSTPASAKPNSPTTNGFPQQVSHPYPPVQTTPASHTHPDKQNGQQLASSATRPYDVRPPPPPPTSSFQPINPPTAGFNPINAAQAAPSTTPPVPAPTKRAQQPSIKAQQGHGLDNAFHHSPTNPPGGRSTPGSTPGPGKRTPSSTHPYTQSEAFNNRHHKCERVDSFNRGVWTSYGPGGTADHPTGDKVEMYLRCNHDDCKRIDWRTVHGLQCHIVKNHEQPKGTIGSLEKALERYGIPVTEVEEYEKQHGPGSGGTVADPKNLKMKTKMAARDSDPVSRSYTVVNIGGTQVPIPGGSPPPTSRPPGRPPHGSMFPNLMSRTASGGFMQDDIVYSDDDEEKEGLEESDRDSDYEEEDSTKFAARRPGSAPAKREWEEGLVVGQSARQASLDQQTQQSLPKSDE